MARSTLGYVWILFRQDFIDYLFPFSNSGCASKNPIYNYPEIIALTVLLFVVSLLTNAILTTKSTLETIPNQSLTLYTPPLILLAQMPF